MANERNVLRVRTIGPVIRSAGLVPWTIAFVALFVVCMFVLVAAEPHINTLGDSAWLLFQVCTTIGLGDFTCTTWAGRMVAVVLSIYSVFFLALVTGAVVSYCSERMQARRNQSVAQFLDQLEHLPELSPEELAELSRKVKELHRKL